jgi:hypothetical protein
VGGTPVEVHAIDEYVHTDLRYMSLLNRPQGSARCWPWWACRATSSIARWTWRPTPGVNGCMAVIGGPHVMTCDTSMLHGAG